MVLDAVSLAMLSALEHKRSARPSYLISIYLFFTTLLDIAEVRTLWLQNRNVAIIGISTASVALKASMLFLESYEKRSFLKAPYSTYPPEALAGILNTSTFYWINDLFKRGYRKVIAVEDLFAIDPALTSDVLEKKILSAWSRQAKHRRRALPQALLSCFRKPILTVIVPRLCVIGFRFSQPLLIHRAISLIEAPETLYSHNVGYGLIGATALIYVGLAVSKVTYQHKMYRLITMIRGSLVCLVHHATLHIDANEADRLAAVTLMSTDIERVTTGFVSLDSLWASPIEAVIAIYLLRLQLGVACVVPAVISLICTISALSIMKWASNSQKEWMEIVEKRVATTAVMLNSIKSLKMQGLTDRVSEILQGLRAQELEYAKPFRRNIICTAGASNITTLGGPILTFMTYVLIEKATSSATLGIAQAFASLSLISLLSTPVSELVQTIPTCAAAMGCLDRIQTYVKIEVQIEQRVPSSGDPARLEPDDAYTRTSIIELQELTSANTTSRAAPCSNDSTIIMLENASIGYSTQGPNILHDINLEVKRGSLTIVAGPVGCGKSTLAKALLGELPCNKGFIRTNVKEIAYCAQEPWLPNRSIREDVLGETVFDPSWYSTVIGACALQSDISTLEDGDQTLIGSNGASLSGGQKQRLALARATYARKQLIVLDSVLSGLDAKTDMVVVEAIFGPNGLCKKHGFSVVLITHATHHARYADHTVIIGNEGTILEQGSYEQLLRRDADVKKLLVEDLPQDDEHAHSSGKNHDIEPKNAAEELTDLTRRSGDLSVYAYLAQSVGWPYCILFLCTVILYALSAELQAVLLQYWSAAETVNPGTYTNMYIGLYAMLAGLSLVGLVSLLANMLLFAGPKMSIRLHEILLRTTMSAPFTWFVSTDSGNTLNRFSQDMSLIDMDLLISLTDTAAGFGMATTEGVLIVLGAKWAVLALPFILGTVYVLQRIYLRTSRQLRYLDLEAKAPLYSHFVETLSGLATIRAFGWSFHTAAKNRELLDLSQRPFYLLYYVQRWLGLVLDLVVAGVAIVLITVATQVRSTTSGGALGIALVNVLNFNVTLGFLVEKWTALETSVGAVARVKGFERDMVNENGPGEGSDVPVHWPFAGELEIGNISVVYKHGSPRILRDISIRIPAGQRVGIVGRTGSGKSSLLLTILRLTELTAGSLTIDGLALTGLKRSALRRALVSIPQDPGLFPGTVRFNADPFSAISDATINAVLRRVGLTAIIQSYGGLYADTDGVKLSRGQQQLFSVARALCWKSALGNRNNGILLLDEITSDVDSETESMVSRILDEDFEGWTTLNVAHRAKTLINYDRVVVLNQGRIVEDGQPAQLRELAGGHFRNLWED